MALYSIVGMNFHRPALGILKVLPLNHELLLIPEPQNQFDKNAIAVWVDGSTIPHTLEDRLEDAVKSSGFCAGEIFSENWKLGYIRKEIAATLQPFTQKTGKFATAADGRPLVNF